MQEFQRGEDGHKHMLTSTPSSPVATSCLHQELQQAQETMTYQVADYQITVGAVTDKRLFI